MTAGLKMTKTKRGLPLVAERMTGFEPATLTLAR